MPAGLPLSQCLYSTPPLFDVRAATPDTRSGRIKLPFSKFPVKSDVRNFNADHKTIQRKADIANPIRSRALPYAEAVGFPSRQLSVTQKSLLELTVDPSSGQPWPNQCSMTLQEKLEADWTRRHQANRLSTSVKGRSFSKQVRFRSVPVSLKSLSRC
jgi:hypothetical protein